MPVGQRWMVEIIGRIATHFKPERDDFYSNLDPALPL
jgi:hypothetical protein